jgi:CD36 family.
LKRLYAEDQFQPNGASDLTYNFYNIDNPEEYLKGDDAILVETGPYVIK